MSYEPTKWNTGDKITADKLNKLEVGVANAGQTFMLEYDRTNSVFSYESALLGGTTSFVVDTAAPASEDIDAPKATGDTKIDGGTSTIYTLNEVYFVDELPSAPCPVMQRSSANGSVEFEDMPGVWIPLYPVDPNTRVETYACLGEAVLAFGTDDILFIPSGTQVVRGTIKGQ